MPQAFFRKQPTTLPSRLWTPTEIRGLHLLTSSIFFAPLLIAFLHLPLSTDTVVGYSAKSWHTAS